MGRKLNALLARRFKTSKLKTAVNLAISRLAILKNNRHARYTIAHSDLIQLLRLNHHHQALLRVEQVIKDKNMLAVYDMIHDYCHLLKQKASLIEQANYCPEELKEAVSSLLYAAPRCGEFPELKEIRAILTARFGKEVTDGATDSRHNSGVCQKMIQKLSSKEVSLENRTMMLTEIAKEDGIILQLDATVLPETVEKVSSLSESVSFYSMKSNLDMSDSSPRCDSESDDDEIIEEEEEEGERSAYDMKAEEYGDLYSDDYSDDDNIKSFEKMDFDASKYKIEKEETGFPSRTVYFSSYKQFPFRHRVEDALCATTGS
ncbi:putative vacuolar protein sorting-associated protein Ist1 [Helianthus debilis subsp. tardiflorus]